MPAVLKRDRRPDDHRDADVHRRQPQDAARRHARVHAQGTADEADGVRRGRHAIRRTCSSRSAISRAARKPTPPAAISISTRNAHRHLRARLQPRLHPVLLLQRRRTSVRIRRPENRLKIPIRAGERRSKYGTETEFEDRFNSVPLTRGRLLCCERSSSTSTASSPTASRCTSASFRDVLADEGVALTEADYYAQYLGYDDVGAFDGDRRRCSRFRGRPRASRELVARKAARLRSARARCRRSCSPAPQTPSGAPPPRCRSRSRRARSAPKSARVLDRDRLTSCFTAIVARRRHAAQQAGARSVSARLAQLLVRRAAGRSERPSAWRSRTRAGASSPRVPQDCAPSPSRRHTASDELPLADLVIPTIAALDIVGSPDLGLCSGSNPRPINPIVGSSSAVRSISPSFSPLQPALALTYWIVPGQRTRFRRVRVRGTVERLFWFWRSADESSRHSFWHWWRFAGDQRAGQRPESQTGEIFGKATDQSGAVLPGVTVTLTGPMLLQPLVAVTQRNRHLSVPAPRNRRLHRQVRAGRLQDGRQRGHPRHRRLQRPGQRAAGHLHRAGDHHGHGPEPDRRHQGNRHEADVHQRAAAEHPVGPRPVGHPPADGRHRHGPREHRRQHVGPAVQLRVARRQPDQQQVVARRRRHHRHGGHRRVAELLRLRRVRGNDDFTPAAST